MSDIEPHEALTSHRPPDRRRLQALATGSRQNAEGMGYAAAVLLPWLLNDVIGYETPDQVLAVLAAMITSVAVRLRERL